MKKKKITTTTQRLLECSLDMKTSFGWDVEDYNKRDAESIKTNSLPNGRLFTIFISIID